MIFIVQSYFDTLLRYAYPEKTDDNSRRHRCFPREITSEKWAQKFHTDDASLPRSGYHFWLVEANFPRDTTNQKHYPDLGSDTLISQTLFRGEHKSFSWKQFATHSFSLFGVACSRRSDGGERVNSYAASAIRGTRWEKKPGELIFCPLPTIWTPGTSYSIFGGIRLSPQTSKSTSESTGSLSLAERWTEIRWQSNSVLTYSVLTDVSKL